MAGPAPGHGNGYPRRGMSPFSPPGRPVFRPPFLMRRSMGEGGRDLLGKRSPFPPHAPPILPKTFIQVCHGPSWRTGRPSSPSPPVTAEKSGWKSPSSLQWRKALGQPSFCPPFPFQPLLQLSLPYAAKRMPFSNAALSFTKYVCFPAFSRRGADSRPAAQRRGPVIPTRTKVLRGDGGAGEGGRFFQKRPPSLGLASPEARYHAHVRSSPDRGIRP